jgi:hypothetical protein
MHEANPYSTSNNILLQSSIWLHAHTFDIFVFIFLTTPRKWKSSPPSTSSTNTLHITKALLEHLICKIYHNPTIGYQFN